MSRYLHNRTNESKPQSVTTKLAGQIYNSDGGAVYAVSQNQLVCRFLILGSEGSSYYASQADKLDLALGAVESIVKNDPYAALATLKDVAETHAAAKKTPSILLLAHLVSHTDLKVRQAAYELLPVVLETPTMFYDFMEFIKHSGTHTGRNAKTGKLEQKSGVRGMGTGFMNALRVWWNDRDNNTLSYWVRKYKGRNEWKLRDVLRLLHINPSNKVQEALLGFSVKNKLSNNLDPEVVKDEAIQRVLYYEMAQVADDANQVINCIKLAKLTHEMIPSKWHNDPRVWFELITDMPYAALVRSLGRTSALNLTKPLSSGEKIIVARLTNPESIKRSKIHPVALLNALMVYKQGHGDKGSLSWTVNQQIVAALETAFYTAFGNVEPTGKRIFVALDVSGSMSSANVNGLKLSARDASLAMALVTTRVEPSTFVGGFSSNFIPLAINKNTTLDEGIRLINRLPFDATNLGSAVNYAIKHGIEVDTFIVYTDNEVNSGENPKTAINRYRKAVNPDAKVIMVGMAMNQFTCADPNDSNMLDVVGFDATAPQIMSEFINGNL